MKFLINFVWGMAWLFLIFGTRTAQATSPVVLASVSYTASGSGSGGSVADFTYTFPANAVMGYMVVVVSWERDHKCPTAVASAPGSNNSGGNWASLAGLLNDDFLAPEISWGDSSLTKISGSFVWDGYANPALDGNFRAELSSELWVYGLPASSFPANETGTVKISNFIGALCNGDEMSVTVLAMDRVMYFESVDVSSAQGGITSLTSPDFLVLSPQQPSNTTDSDNMIMNIHSITCDTGTVTPTVNENDGGVIIQLMGSTSPVSNSSSSVSNTNGDYKGANQNADFTENDGLQTNVSSVASGLSFLVNNQISYTGAAPAQMHLHSFRVVPPDPGMLPVQWSSFEGYLNDRDVILDWETMMEVNNDRFEIEFSTDGQDFNTLATVFALEPNSSEATQYHFIHQNATKHNAEVLYYRLKQFDLNGTHHFSEMVAVSVPPKEPSKAYIVYPNPAAQDAPVKIRGVKNGSLIWIFDEHKRFISTLVNESNSYAEEYSLILPPGIYYIAVDERWTRLVVLD